MNGSSFGQFLMMVFSWRFFLNVLITLNFFKIFLHFGTFKYVMKKKALTTMRMVLSKCLNLIFYSLIGTCYPNFEQKHLILILHESLAFKRKVASMDFVGDNVFPSHSEIKIHYTTHTMNVDFMHKLVINLLNVYFEYNKVSCKIFTKYMGTILQVYPNILIILPKVITNDIYYLSYIYKNFLVIKK